jgi:hypothetical protein
VFCANEMTWISRNLDDGRFGLFFEVEGMWCNMRSAEPTLHVKRGARECYKISGWSQRGKRWRWLSVGWKLITLITCRPVATSLLCKQKGILGLVRQAAPQI